MLPGPPPPLHALPPGNALRQHIAAYQPDSGPQQVEPVRPGRMQPLQQGNQQAMLGAMRGYLQ